MSQFKVLDVYDITNRGHVIIVDSDGSPQIGDSFCRDSDGYQWTIRGVMMLHTPAGHIRPTAASPRKEEFLLGGFVEPEVGDLLDLIPKGDPA